jgi:O-antigen ligase
MKILIAATVIFLPLIVLFAVPRLQRSNLAFTEGGSGLFRINQLKESVNLITKYPLFGVGQDMSVLGMFLENPLGEMYYFPTPTHNMYLNLAEEIGLIPFLLFFSFLFILLSPKIPSTINNLLSHKIPGLIFFSATISILLNGLVQPVYSSTMLYLLIFATIYNAYAKLS